MPPPVLETPDISIIDTRCATTAISGPQDVPGQDRFEVLFVWAGCFTLRDARGTVLVDSTTCVMGSPGQSAEVAHPVPGGDRYTQITMSAQVWHQLTGDEEVPLSARVPGWMQVAGRAMAAAGHHGVDAMTLEEGALNLVAAAVARSNSARVESGRPSTIRSRRQLVEDARTILIGDSAASSVREVAARLDCSPYHLSRVFRAQTGMTVAGYRTQLRVNLALQMLTDGGIAIAEAAALCGFADQSHLTRALRHHTGFTPAQVRRAVNSTSDAAGDGPRSGTS